MFGVDPEDDAGRVHDALDQVMSGFLWMMTFPVDGVDRWPLPASLRHRRAVAALNDVVDRLVARRRAKGTLGGDLLSDWVNAHDRGELSLVRAFNEALRLYPPAWVMARATREPLDLGAATVEAGRFLFVPIAAMHRDPRWWTDPESFRPERFLAPPPAAFIPFGVGPRRCIGEGFARHEARVALAAVLRRFRVEADRVPKPVASVALRPLGGAPVRLVPIA